jgi:hypothetical protein
LSLGPAYSFESYPISPRMVQMGLLDFHLDM